MIAAAVTTLALALNQAGLKPALIDPVVFDAQVAPTFDGRASAIAYAAFRQWRALGVGEALERVSLGANYAARYPEELSGGERQRVAIARALVAGPKVLICDEVTSALDVSVQAAIVQLLRRLQEEMGLTMLFVTHNLALVRSIAQRVAVMSEGRIVELGPTEQVLGAPEVDYTRRLLADTPSLATVRG